tara:strand:- start:1480 stop:1623 length:144 start_codon:yes stop_codon:yes gene_type:complete
MFLEEIEEYVTVHVVTTVVVMMIVNVQGVYYVLNVVTQQAIVTALIV